MYDSITKDRMLEKSFKRRNKIVKAFDSAPPAVVNTFKVL